MTRNRLTYLISVCLALVLVAPVMAQRSSGGGGIEMLQAALDQTDNLIERSEGVIRASGSEPALQTFENAQELQNSAKARFQERTLSGYAAAKILTMKARDQVRRALRLVSPGQGTNELQDGVVQRRLDRADDKLDRTHELLTEGNNPSLDALYQGARNNLDQAWEFYRGKRYRPALKLADEVETAADKLLALARDDSRQGTAGFERRYDNVSQIIDQVGQMLQSCQSTSAQALLDQAKRSLDQAKALHDQNLPGALTPLQTARDLALKAERLCQGDNQLEQRYAQLMARLDKVTEQAQGMAGGTADAVSKLLAQARAQLALARGYLDQHQSEQAQAALQAGHLAIQQAEGYLQPAR